MHTLFSIVWFYNEIQNRLYVAWTINLFFPGVSECSSAGNDKVNKCKWDAIWWRGGGIGEIMGMGFLKYKWQITHILSSSSFYTHWVNVNLPVPADRHHIAAKINCTSSTWIYNLYWAKNICQLSHHYLRVPVNFQKDAVAHLVTLTVCRKGISHSYCII